MDEKLIENAIRDTVAKSILEGIDTEARDAILQKSIEKTLKDYTFRQAVEKEVAEKAKEKVREMLATEDWKVRIEQELREGFEKYLANLRHSMEDSLTAFFHGKNDSGYGNRCGHVLQCWPKD